jgi:nucleoid-associated protein YgaU
VVQVTPDGKVVIAPAGSAPAPRRSTATTTTTPSAPERHRAPLAPRVPRHAPRPAAPPAAPATSAVPAAPVAPVAVATTHVVVPGDNLWRIAATRLQQHHARPPSDEEIAPYWRAVVDANRATLRSGDPNLIFPGELVALPPPA